MNTVVLNGKKELDIYINPQRQRLLRLLTLHGAPMTPKQLSDEMGISPSSVQYHIKKLVALGVVGLSHTHRINGITAHYYRALPVTVSIGLALNDENDTQRFTMMQNGVTEVFNGFAAYLKQIRGAAPPPDPAGDLLCGVARLETEEARELMKLIHTFLEEHNQPDRPGDPWEYTLIAYPAQEDSHA